MTFGTLEKGPLHIFKEERHLYFHFANLIEGKSTTGKILADGTPDELFESDNQEVRGFLRDISVNPTTDSQAGPGASGTISSGKGS